MHYGLQLKKCTTGYNLKKIQKTNYRKLNKITQKNEYLMICSVDYLSILTLLIILEINKKFPLLNNNFSVILKTRCKHKCNMKNKREFVKDIKFSQKL